MKKVTLFLILAVLLTACGQNTQKSDSQASGLSTENDIVNVYYFHGKQRCKTCIAVGNIAKQTIETAFAGNDKVRFVEINTNEKVHETLVEKYEVTWNALIIAKGENSIEITEQAFATAIGNPQELENLIKQEVNKRLQ
ncbi:hypothetical protein HW49_07825 [Porphyromonadaceae bacterium COT-184 OH4590]|nr:hypothetical protein HW49_07825 [Porphyromonadaceae bacterium COT-184 OH4590]